MLILSRAIYWLYSPVTGPYIPLDMTAISISLALHPRQISVTFLCCRIWRIDCEIMGFYNDKSFRISTQFRSDINYARRGEANVATQWRIRATSCCKDFTHQTQIRALALNKIKVWKLIVKCVILPGVRARMMIFVTYTCIHQLMTREPIPLDDCPAVQQETSTKLFPGRSTANHNAPPPTPAIN